MPWHMGLLRAYLVYMNWENKRISEPAGLEAGIVHLLLLAVRRYGVGEEISIKQSYLEP
jgi:hypothetical protein